MERLVQVTFFLGDNLRRWNETSLFRHTPWFGLEQLLRRRLIIKRLGCRWDLLDRLAQFRCWRGGELNHVFLHGRGCLGTFDATEKFLLSLRYVCFTLVRLLLWYAWRHSIFLRGRGRRLLLLLLGRKELDLVLLLLIGLEGLGISQLSLDYLLLVLKVLIFLFLVLLVTLLLIFFTLLIFFILNLRCLIPLLLLYLKLWLLLCNSSRIFLLHLDAIDSRYWLLRRRSHLRWVFHHLHSIGLLGAV